MIDMSMTSDGAPRRSALPRAKGERAIKRDGAAALGLGLFSVGLGLAEIFAPRVLARLVGARRGPLASASVMRGLGAREIAVGAGLLARERSAPWLWARVAGDVIDLSMLGLSARRAGDGRGRTLGALAAVAGVTALDALAAASATRGAPGAEAASLEKAITIARPRAAVYGFWRDLRNVPRFMADVESVDLLDERRSRWTARGPVGPVVSWEAVIDEDRPVERLSWRSVEGSDVQTSGVVTLSDAPEGRGTEVRLVLSYAPRAGAAARALGRFLWHAGAAARVEGDLRRCKQLIETGHVVHSDASVHRGPHPARPATPSETREERS